MWCAAQVIRILKNEMLIGNMVQSKSSLVSYKVKKLIHKPREEWDIVEGTHEPIISEADFAIVQSLLERDVIKIADTENPNMFAGLVFCGNCGKSLIRRKRTLKSGPVFHFLCSGYNKKSGCTSHDILESEMIEIVLESINRMICKLCHYDELARSLEDLHIPKDAVLVQNQEIQKLKEELSKCGRLKSALYQDLKEGMISGAQFDRYRNQYTDREIRLQHAIQEQKALVEKIYKNGIVEDGILKQFQENPHVEELNHRLLVRLINRIVVYDDNTVEIVYRYADELKKCEQILHSIVRRISWQERKIDIMRWQNRLRRPKPPMNHGEQVYIQDCLLSSSVANQNRLKIKWKL